jgi:excinuclease ABC subunit B
VSLVAILDADQEGFLRSARSLMQVAGRAARNVAGRVIFYGDKITDSMKHVIDETNRRRELQRRYNEEHGITPESIIKSVEDILRTTTVADARLKQVAEEPKKDYMTVYDLENLISRLEKEMRRQAKAQEFEEAAKLRDEINRLKEQLE